MSDATARGWGDPRAKGFQANNIVPVSVGPFPAKGPLKKPHPRIFVNFHREGAFLLQMFLTEIITKGYRLDGKADDWGFCFRPIRGYELKYKLTRFLKYLSLHSWGNAVDINAATNPMTSDGRNHTDMPAWVIEAGRRWGFEWGGDYSGKRKDPMHFELTMTMAACIQKVRDTKKFFEGLTK